jgi:hypothetical protein
LFGEWYYCSNVVRLKDGRNSAISERLGGLLALAVSTADVIDWRKLQQRLSESPPGLKHSERVRVLLQVANGYCVTARQVNQLAGLTLFRGNDAGMLRLPDEHCAPLRAGMHILTEGTDAEREELIRDVTRTASELMVVVPTLQPNGVRADRIVAASVGAGLAYGLALLLDPALPYARTLRRCPYSRCGRFFLVSGARGAPPKYCRQSHSRLGDRERAAERMTRLRRKRK